MKHNRIRVGIALALCIALVGCGDLPNLSEQQSDEIAEYAGGVLLRYSSKYAWRLVQNDADEDGIEDAKKDVVSGAAVETQEPSPTPTPVASPVGSETPADTSAAPGDTPEPVPTEEPTVTLDELYGISGLEFTYKSAAFANKYPEKSDLVEITPDKGEILYVVKFNVKNTSKKAVKVNLTKRAIHYELEMGGDTILPTLSLLPNGGLNYLMTTIKPGKSEEAVLIFNLDKSKKGTKDNVLTMTEDNKTAKIDL